MKTSEQKKVDSFQSRSAVSFQDALPDITRPDAGAIMISEWEVATAQRQRTAIDAIAAAWEPEPHPANLLSYSVFPSLDGETLLHYSQWQNEDDFHAFTRAHRQVRVDKIDALVPGIERVGLGRYRLYRNYHATGPAIHTGCIAIVRIEAEGPDRQRQWIDTVIEALAGDRIPGLISAHFHVCDDGRILNYAQWESEAAYRMALGTGGPGIAQTESTAWHLARTMPGITQKGFKLFGLPRRIEGARLAGAQLVHQNGQSRQPGATNLK